MTVLIDTNMLLAFAFARDANHELASRTLHSLSQETRIVPTPVLTELFYIWTLANSILPATFY